MLPFVVCSRALMAVLASWHLLTDNAPHCLRVQTWADKGVCRVVFITSAGSFLDSVAGELAAISRNNPLVPAGMTPRARLH